MPLRGNHQAAPVEGACVGAGAARSCSGTAAASHPDRRAVLSQIAAPQLEDKKLKKDGRHALVMVVSVVEMLLPHAARLAYAAASDREGSRPARKKKYASKKAGPKKSGAAT